MNNNTCSTDTMSTLANHHQSRLCWSAIFSGAFVGLGLGFLLQLFGIAISLSAYNSSAGATTIAIGGFLGLLIGVIVSMGAAGYVTGYLGRFYYSRCHGGVIYGFLTWSLALLLTAIFLAPLTHYVSTYNKTLAPHVVVSDSMPQTDMTTTTNNSSSATVQKKSVTTTDESLVKVTPNTLTGSSWLIFLLFFIGAISSCIGACCGMCCNRGEFCDVTSEPTHVTRTRTTIR